MVDDKDEKLMAAQRREYIFLARTLQTEREMERLRSQVEDARVPANESLTGTMVDPTVNMEIKFLRQKLLDQGQQIHDLRDQLNATFDVKSSAGQKLVKKCTHLLEENQELGKQLAQDRTQDFQVLLDAERKKTDEAKDRLREQLEFNQVLDAENEKMQNTLTQLVRKVRDLASERDDLAAQLKELGHQPRRTPPASTSGEAPSAKRHRSS